MSAPDDHAVLGGHQFLNVVALHVKVGIAPAACPAAPSTAKADIDRYKGHASISGRRRSRKRCESRSPARVTAPADARQPWSQARTRARLAYVTRKGVGLVPRASLRAARSPARRPPSTAISEISRALPRRDRVSALSAARRRLIAALSVRLENEHHEREGWDAANRSVI